MTPDEKRIAREMHFDRGMPPVGVAEALGRGLSSICRLLAQKKAPKPSGGQRKLTETMIDKTVTTLELMVDEADAEREVTLPMVMRRCRLKVRRWSANGTEVPHPSAFNWLARCCSLAGRG